MTDADDLIAQLESTQFQHDAECELGFGSGLCKCYERLLHKAAAHLRAQKVETARLQKLEKQCWTSPEQWMAWCDVRMLERAEKAEAERDALAKLLMTAQPLAAATLSAALRWNDHNYDDDAPNRWAKEAADKAGFPRTLKGDEDAVNWLNAIDAALAKLEGEGR